MIVHKSLHEKMKYVNKNLDSKDSIKIIKQDMGKYKHVVCLFIVTSTGKKWSTNT